jgi:hypothetical protein
MAYTPHVLVALGGSWVGDTGEMWECTVRLRADGGGGVTIDPEAYLADIKPNLSTWFHAVDTGMMMSSRLKWIKCNHIGADGLYVDPTTTHVTDYSPAVAGGMADAGPGFCSIAYTWETAVARGPGHRGRVYMPNCTVAGSGSVFKIGTGSRDQNATAGAGLLAVLKNSAGANGTKGTPVVASKIGGAIHDIVACTSDDIFDVQRRRKDRIIGSRSGPFAFA